MLWGVRIESRICDHRVGGGGVFFLTTVRLVLGGGGDL